MRDIFSIPRPWGQPYLFFSYLRLIVSTAPGRGSKHGRDPFLEKVISVNLVQTSMLALANKNMKHYRRTWWNYPRQAEQTWLSAWYKKTIGLSWLDDNRAVLKKEVWVRRWQSGRRNPEGTFHGSEARGQFTWKTVCYLSSLGIVVFREVYALAKRAWTAQNLPTATPLQSQSLPEELDPDLDYGRFGDPEFRKSKNMATTPPTPKV